MPDRLSRQPKSQSQLLPDGQNSQTDSLHSGTYSLTNCVRSLTDCLNTQPRKSVLNTSIDTSDTRRTALTSKRTT